MDADAELRAAGYEPLEPYPGTVAAQWHARCTICGAERRPSLHDLRKGKRCAHRGVATTPEAAADQARSAGFEPLEPYSGDRTSPWRVRCTACGAGRTPSLKSLREGWTCRHRYVEISHSTTARDAADELQAAGYEPLEVYPGKTKAAWRARCSECGARRTVTLNRVRSGERCKHRLAPKKRSGYSSLTNLPADQVISRYEAGESMQQIAELYDTSANTIRRLLDQHGVERRRAHHKFDPEHWRGTRVSASLPAEKVISEYRQGATLTELAKAYGVSVNSILRVMDARGEKRRASRPKAGVSRILSAKTEAEILRRNQAGESLRSIAASLGISRGAVTGALQRQSAQPSGPPRGPRPDLSVDEIARRHAAGESVQALADEYGVSQVTIRRRLKAASTEGSTREH